MINGPLQIQKNYKNPKSERVLISNSNYKSTLINYLSVTRCCFLIIYSESLRRLLNAPRRWVRRSRDATGGRPSSVPPPFWLRCRRYSCLEEMGTGNERIWSFSDPISWVCEWRQNRTLNLNFKKVCGVKTNWPSLGRGRVCCCWRHCCTTKIVSSWKAESRWLFNSRSTRGIIYKLLLICMYIC